MRTLVLVLVVGVCAAGCGPSDEEKRAAAAFVDVYLEAGREGDYETIWLLIHPEDKAFYTWSVSLNQLRFLATEAEDREAVEADIRALMDTRGVKDLEQTGEDTPNPASIESVIALTAKMLDGVDHLALIRDAAALFEKHGMTWDPFHEFRRVKVDHVDVLDDGALVVFQGDPEPKIWLTSLDGSWFARYREPPPVVIENWQRAYGSK